MLKQLKYFQSVVRLNSFSQAAEENFISQSAISQQIQALERELGFPLLVRRSRTFTLTPAGEYIYQRSLILTADYERMCSEAAKIAKGDRDSLRIGYLRSYTGAEFHRALARFSEKHPEVDVSVAYGNHEELYGLLRTGEADMVFNDQRRAFSDEYVNLLLTSCRVCVEVSVHSPLAQAEHLSLSDLKNFPCILVASETQREAEQAYYRDVIGFRGEFLYAENPEEARLMVIGRKGFFPAEGAGQAASAEISVTRIPLVRDESPILQNYCAFWKKGSVCRYAEEFAGLLKAQFAGGNTIHGNGAAEQ